MRQGCRKEVFLRFAKPRLRSHAAQALDLPVAIHRISNYARSRRPALEGGLTMRREEGRSRKTPWSARKRSGSWPQGLPV